MPWWPNSLSCALRGPALRCGAAVLLVGCSDDVFAPTVDCEGAVGAVFIELVSSGSVLRDDLRVNVGDSVRVVTGLRRVDKSEETFNVQVGWSCTTVESSAVVGLVTLSTTDTSVVRIGPDGWIHGRAQGWALISASAGDSTVSPAYFAAIVHAP